MRSTPETRWRFGLSLSIGVGAAAAAAGAFLFVLAATSSGPPVKLIGALLVLFALLEIGVGAAVGHRGGASMALVLSGFLSVGFAVFALGPMSASPWGIALLMAIYLMANALFEGLDLAIDRPRPWLTEGIYTVVAGALGIYLFLTWQSATAATLGWVVGCELIARGASIIATTRMTQLHPDWDGYRLAH